MSVQPPAQRLGTRGELLLWFSAVWIVFGVGVLIEVANGPDKALLYAYLPVWFRVTIWWLPAVVAVYAAFTKRAVWLATGLLMLAPIERATSYLWAWITYIAPVGEVGKSSGGYVAMFYIALIALVWIATRVREPLAGGPHG